MRNSGDSAPKSPARDFKIPDFISEPKKTGSLGHEQSSVEWLQTKMTVGQGDAAMGSGQ